MNSRNDTVLFVIKCSVHEENCDPVKCLLILRPQIRSIRNNNFQITFSNYMALDIKLLTDTPSPESTFQHVIFYIYDLIMTLTIDLLISKLISSSLSSPAP